MNRLRRKRNVLFAFMSCGRKLTKEINRIHAFACELIVLHEHVVGAELEHAEPAYQLEGGFRLQKRVYKHREEKSLTRNASLVFSKVGSKGSLLPVCPALLALPLHAANARAVCGR